MMPESFLLYTSQLQKFDMVAARYDDDYDDDDDDDDDDHVHVHVHVHLGPLFLFRMRDPEAACCGDT